MKRGLSDTHSAFNATKKTTGSSFVKGPKAEFKSSLLRKEKKNKTQHLSFTSRETYLKGWFIFLNGNILAWVPVLLIMTEAAGLLRHHCPLNMWKCQTRAEQERKGQSEAGSHLKDLVNFFFTSSLYLMYHYRILPVFDCFVSTLLWCSLWSLEHLKCVSVLFFWCFRFPSLSVFHLKCALMLKLTVSLLHVVAGGGPRKARWIIAAFLWLFKL